jgi:hypothetical protein
MENAIELKVGDTITLSKYGHEYRATLKERTRRYVFEVNKRSRAVWKIYDSQLGEYRYLREDYIKARLQGKRGGGERKNAIGKYIGKIYDGRWQVVERVGNRTHISFILENIYNQKKVRVQCHSLKKVDDGKTTLSKVIAHQIKTRTGKYGI